MERETVLEFLETNTVPPTKLTVERTTQSKYLFYLTIRHFRRRLRLKPRFFMYSRSDAGTVKAIAEEHSLWQDQGFLVLEGFGQSFIDGLDPPKDVYILAETDGGQLKPELYSYKTRRNILKVLQGQLGLGHMSLRALLKLDWSMTRSFEEIETLLLKAKLMDWTEEDIGSQLEGIERTNVLVALKRSVFKEIFSLMDMYGAAWLVRHTTRQLTELMHYKALRLMGHEESRSAKELDVGWRRMQELEEGNMMYTAEDLTILAERLIKLDRLIQKRPSLGVSILFLNAPIQVKK